MKKIISKLGMYLVLAGILNIRSTLNAQNMGINATGTPPDNSALLDVDAQGLPSNNKKGLLIPRMTTAERNAIPSPANSLLIFNTTTNCFEWWSSATSSWQIFACACTTPTSAPTANTASGVGQTSLTANWGSVSGATCYQLDVAMDAAFTTFVPGYYNLNVGNVTSFNVTGLTCNTVYYYRVRACNSCGASANSNMITVKTSACPPVACGSQVFMSVNLDVGIQINQSTNQTNNSVVEKWCISDIPANCTTLGGLYQWDEAMQYNASVNCDPCGPTTGYGGVQGICPAGYHIPSDLEWSRYEWCVENNIAPTGSTPLSTFQTGTGWRGSNTTAGPGAKMKSNTSWDGTNASGFNALPTGFSGGGMSWNISDAYFWSATEEFTPTIAWRRFLGPGSAMSHRGSNFKTTGYSVRCLQD